MFAVLAKKPHWYHFLFLFLSAFIVRSTLFYYYMQHEERYHQSDSLDYHVAGFCVAHGFGMHRPDLNKPIFWRTPGYPWYLSHFLKQYGHPQSGALSNNTLAHKLSILVQIFLCSFLPLLLFWLAYILTNTYLIAWLTALISVIHIGFVLASTYLLTDALAMLFFVLFLIFYYKSFKLVGETPKPEKKSALIYLVCAAINLALYTWMRPMGQFIGIISAVLLLFSHDTWSNKLKKIFLFLVLFFALLAPWFIRNHRLTGSYFFCPLFGLYFNVFNAPKIVARTENIPLLDAHKKLTYEAAVVTAQEMARARANNSPYVVCGELVCLQTAWPVIAAHPFYFIYDWIVEVLKTTFDLYSYQLVALYNNCFKWDPLVEYLPEKIQECLYKKPLAPTMRILAWLELFASIFLWFGIFAGIFRFLLYSLFYKAPQDILNKALLWVKTGIIIGATVFQTGGFGYARLRLPVEPLMLILALTFWYWFFTQKKK